MGMFNGGDSIYKNGLDESDISKLMTDWKDVTNEFTLNDSNLELNYGKILKNEMSKQIKISVRLDLKYLESLPQYSVVEKQNLLSSGYIYEPGISSFSAAYMEDLTLPIGLCMMWNDEHSINVQIVNPSIYTTLKGFIIESTLIYK